jgi:NAD(P)-dependent dehydrogenase (short-subunit alcohol dehydrogenase family)
VTAVKDLAGKTAVITGAASGMGRAFANRFAQAGMNIVLADIEPPALASATDEVRALGVDVLGVPTDVSNPDAVDRLRDEALGRFGRVNLLCNNAGVGGSFMGGPIRIQDWQWVMGVNFWGVVHGHRSFLPHFYEHGDAHIVNTSSMAGHLPSHSPYGASKFAVAGISEGLYHQLQMMKSTVGISCLCPGFVSTNIGSSERNRPEWAAPGALEEPEPAAEAMQQMLVERIAGGRPPREVADLVHDAVVSGKFWIFTDLAMVQAVRPRMEAILEDRNPPMLGMV